MRATNYGCSGLTSVTITDGVQSIGVAAFQYCSGLTSVTNMAAVPQPIGSYTFSKYSGATLHVLEGCKEAYAAADYWKNFTIVDDIPTIKVSAITLDKTVYSCEVGGVAQASVASILPTDATIQQVTWSVGDPSIAFVDKTTGQFVGLQEGATTITATAADGSGVTATALVKVGEAAIVYVTSIELSQSSYSLTVGESLTASVANILPADATAKSVTWSSNDPTVATINSSTGEITGMQEGTTTITATAIDGSGVTATATVNVSTPEIYKGIKLNQLFGFSTPTRGAWTMVDTTLKGTGQSGVNQTVDVQNTNQQFALYMYKGQVYLWSESAQHFLNNSGQAVSILNASPVAWTAEEGNTFFFHFTDAADKYINLGGSKEIAIDSWNSADAGNKMTLTPVEGFDLAAVQAVIADELSDKTYTVTITGTADGRLIYNDTEYANGSSFDASGLKASQLSAKGVSGYYSSIVLDGTSITVTYTAMPFTVGKTYRIYLRNGYVNYNGENGQFNVSATFPADDTKGHFTIGGDATHGYTLYNVAAGKYLYHADPTSDDSKATTTANESEATRYDWSTIDGYSFFKIHDTDNVYVNQRGGYFSTWKNSMAFGDNGSRLTFEGVKRVFIDAADYTALTSIACGTLTYTRTFDNANWQALYVPFSMDYDEWSEKYDIAEIHNFIEYDDDENGEFDRTYLVVLKKTSGSTEPNYPYLIRAKETGTHSLVLTDKTLEAAESNSIDCSSVKNRYTFTGTYQPVTDMYAHGYYAMNGGSLQQAASSSVTLNPQRWYMAVTSRTGSSASVKAQTIRILVDGEDDVEGISELANEGISTFGNAGFDLQGRAVSTATNVRGITISNGKKVIR